jgi:RNA polymerase sigma factor (sigma-70 family)
MRLVLHRLRKAVSGCGEAASTDGALLERFVQKRDEAAFEALLQRHAPLVLGVCRRVLRDEQDAEDAFQATFLVLVRKAASLDRQGSLAPWLYTVAYHAALRTREQAARRRREERQVLPMTAVVPDDDILWRDLRPVLDEELARLGEKYRAPIVLCYLQGKTHDQAARELGWPIGTVAGRLSRARNVLRRRLVRRGIALSVGALTAGLASNASAAVPPALAGGTVKAAVLLATGQRVVGAFSAQVVALSEAVLRSLATGRVKVLLVGLLSLALLGGSVGVAYRAWHEAPATPEPRASAPAPHVQAYAWAIQPEPAALPDWPMYRGDPSRSAHTAGAAPNPRMLWQRGTVLTPDAQEWLRQAVRKFGAGQRPLLPGFFPLIVGGKVVYPSHWGLHAVDLGSGELVWDTPSCGGLDRLLGKNAERHNALLARAWLERHLRSTQPRPVPLENSVVGTLSSDGRRVYRVDDLAAPPSARVAAWPPLAEHSASNRLQAFDLASGRLLWELGGARSILSKVYFLGPPLPLGGKLYALVHQETARAGDLCLMSLDPTRTPHPAIDWSMSLAEGLALFSRDPTRRTLAAHIAAGEGMLVCPTNAGTLVGVDPKRRRRVWTYTYRPTKTPAPRPGTTWAVTAPLIHAGKVVFTAPDGDAVHCLRLRDGKHLWTARRGQDLYLGAVSAGNVLLVGRKRCRALRLADGRVVWRLTTGRPSGQGSARGGSYYLPLESAASTGRPGVAILDAARGRILAHIPWEKGEAPGNLVFAGRRVLSQSSTRLTAHAQERKPAEEGPGSPPPSTVWGRRTRACARPLPGSFSGLGEGFMAKPLVSNALWERIEPLLPAAKPRRSRHPGRKPLDPRRILTGILFVLKSGIPWEELPVEMGCGCGMTCLNYLKNWQQKGVWTRVLHVLQDHLPDADRLDWTRVGGNLPQGRAQQSAQGPRPAPDQGDWQASAMHRTTAPPRASWMMAPQALA